MDELTVVSKNMASPAAVALAPSLRDVFGLPALPPSEPFDLPLCRAIADWQRSAGLQADGDLGPATRARIAALGYLTDAPCPWLWPNDSEDAGVHWAAVARAAGAQEFGARPLLIGLRGVYPFARATHRMIHAPRYDDSFVALVPGKKPVVFAGATHAYQLRSSESPGGNVGSIRPGLYSMKLASASPPEFVVWTRDGSPSLPAYRDTDHNGVISEAEALASEAAVKGPQVVAGVGTVATAVLFHPGYTSLVPGGARPFSSIACQTAPLERVAFLRDSSREWDYVLTNASDLDSSARPLMPTLPPESRA